MRAWRQMLLVQHFVIMLVLNVELVDVKHVVIVLLQADELLTRGSF